VADRISVSGVLAGEDGEVVLCEAQVRWVPTAASGRLAADGWKLQQLYSISTWKAGSIEDSRTEWRDVPMVEAE
jgi:hypothetical protein